MSEKTRNWLFRLKAGLSRTSSHLTDGITDLLAKRKLDSETLEALEELLISADLGVTTATELVTALAKNRFDKKITSKKVREVFAENIIQILAPVAHPLDIRGKNRPHVILMCGVNGSGKTTTIGKFAKQYKEQGLSVTLVAGDTFRAAAVEQLKVWGERTSCPVIARDVAGGDAAGLCYDALRQARDQDTDVLIIDTAGRLQNKSSLMEELKKVVRVIRKIDETAPHSCLLVLDATVGQNAHSQVKAFRNVIGIDGLVITKLDGTAKGGVVVALAEKFGLPIHAIGIGEGIDDMRPFDAYAFSRNLIGLNT